MKIDCRQLSGIGRAGLGPEQARRFLFQMPGVARVSASGPQRADGSEGRAAGWSEGRDEERSATGAGLNEEHFLTVRTRSKTPVLADRSLLRPMSSSPDGLPKARPFEAPRRLPPVCEIRGAKVKQIPDNLFRSFEVSARPSSVRLHCPRR